MNYLMKTIIFLSSILYSVNLQKEPPLPIKPEKCFGTDNILERQCCIFPPFFNREAARECGANAAITFMYRQENITSFRRSALKSCNHWQCLLDKYRLLDSEGYVNNEKYYDHLTKWVKLNPAFNSIIMNAKVHCKEYFRVFMPLSTCEFFNFQSCIRNFVTVDCPVIIPTPECREWKDFYDECREYFI